jgi:hypothetical protein
MAQMFISQHFLEREANESKEKDNYSFASFLNPWLFFDNRGLFNLCVY